MVYEWVLWGTVFQDLLLSWLDLEQNLSLLLFYELLQFAWTYFLILGTLKKVGVFYRTFAVALVCLIHWTHVFVLFFMLDWEWLSDTLVFILGPWNLNWIYNPSIWVLSRWTLQWWLLCLLSCLVSKRAYDFLHAILTVWLRFLQLTGFRSIVGLRSLFWRWRGDDH